MTPPHAAELQPAAADPSGPDAVWLARLSGKFVVFDGPDGSGKSTQFKRLQDAAARAGLTVCDVREPGGTAVGERVRAILLDPVHDEMTVRCEMLLYMASRAQLVEQRISPALKRGELVLADRFISSTLAYQGAAGGLPREEIVAVGRAACAGVEPDLVVIFDVDEATACARLAPTASIKQGKKPRGGGGTGGAAPDAGASLFADRMERKGVEFRAKVREGYLSQAREWPARYAVIDARSNADEVTAALMRALRERFAS